MVGRRWFDRLRPEGFSACWNLQQKQALFSHSASNLTHPQHSCPPRMTKRNPSFTTEAPVYQEQVITLTKDIDTTSPPTMDQPPQLAYTELKEQIVGKSNPPPRAATASDTDIAQTQRFTFSQASQSTTVGPIQSLRTLSESSAFWYQMGSERACFSAILYGAGR